jgi:hypothetical protein
VKIATGVVGTSYTAQGTSVYNTYAFSVQATNIAGSSAVSISVPALKAGLLKVSVSIAGVSFKSSTVLVSYPLQGPQSV